MPGSECGAARVAPESRASGHGPYGDTTTGSRWRPACTRILSGPPRSAGPYGRGAPALRRVRHRAGDRRRGAPGAGCARARLLFFPQHRRFPARVQRLGIPGPRRGQAEKRKPGRPGQALPGNSCASPSTSSRTFPPRTSPGASDKNLGAPLKQRPRKESCAPSGRCWSTLPPTTLTTWTKQSGRETRRRMTARTGSRAA